MKASIRFLRTQHNKRFKTDSFSATRESAYLHASMSAATMHTISRGCMAGKLSDYCACSEEGRPRSLQKKDIWGGCGDNLPYGYKFSKQFSDAGEQLTESSLESFSRVLMNLHNNEAGRWVSGVSSYFYLFHISIEVQKQ